MNTYWDLSEQERSALSADDVQRYVDAELMLKGVLKVKPLELEPEPAIPTPTTKAVLAQVDELNGAQRDLIERDLADGCMACDIGSDGSGACDPSHSFAKNCKRATPSSSPTPGHTCEVGELVYDLTCEGCVAMMRAEREKVRREVIEECVTIAKREQAYWSRRAAPDGQFAAENIETAIRAAEQKGGAA